jgi:ribosomal protein S18 acetylase RimI-like enzyme
MTLELARALHELEARGQAGLVPHWSVDEYAGELESAEGQRFLWNEAGVLSGFVLYRVTFDEAWVLNLAVGDKGQGLGSKLLTAFFEALKKKHPQAKTCGLEVRAGNAAAARLYAKLGFRKVSSRPRYYRDGQDADVYLREI